MSEDTTTQAAGSDAGAEQQGDLTPSEGVQEQEQTTATEQSEGNQGEQETEAKPQQEGKSILADDEDSKNEDEAQDGEKEKADGDVEYEDFKMPAGIQVDQQALDAAVPKFKEMGFSQDQAQGVVDLYIEETNRQREEAVRALNEQRKAWRDELKAEPDFAKNAGHAKRALKAFADKETIAMFHESWMGDNPGLFRMLTKAGKAIADDPFIEGARGANRPERAEEVLFGDMFKK